MKFTLSVLFAAILCSSAVHAQVSIGPIVGVNMTQYRFNGIASSLFYSNSRAGATNGTPVDAINIRVGALADLQVDNNWHLQPGILYSSSTHKVASEWSDSHGHGTALLTFNLKAIEIPINIVYKTHRKNRSHFLFGAGPYLAIHTDGSMYEVSKTSLGVSSDRQEMSPINIGKPVASGINFRRFSCGLGANAGYELKNGLSARLFCQTSIANYYVVDFKGQYLCSHYGMALAYQFHLKKNNKQAKEEGKLR